MASPFVERLQKRLDGLIFRPELAVQYVYIGNCARALFCDQLFDGRMTVCRIAPGLVVPQLFTILPVRFSHGYRSRMFQFSGGDALQQRKTKKRRGPFRGTFAGNNSRLLIAAVSHRGFVLRPWKKPAMDTKGHHYTANRSREDLSRTERSDVAVLSEFGSSVQIPATPAVSIDVSITPL